MLLRCVSALAFLPAAYAGSSSNDEFKIDWDDLKVTNCVNGKCTSEWTLPSDEDMTDDCFTIKDSVWVNEYKKIDFGSHYLPDKAYTCLYMTGGTNIGKQGFGESTFDTFVMSHTVTNVEKMAFKKVKTTTGESLKVLQLCNPADSTFTNVTFDERWAEDTDPEPEIIKECALTGLDDKYGLSYQAEETPPVTSAGNSASIEVGAFALGVVALIGAGMI